MRRNFVWNSVSPGTLNSPLEPMSRESTTPVDDFAIRARAYWQEHGGRMTVVREIICRTITGWDSSFVAEELWQEARKHDRGISIASIYRTLTSLLQAGLLREIHGPREERSYVKSASATASSGHLICRDCHRIVPLSADCLALREGAMIRSLGFETGGMHLQIEAACESLKRCGACENHRNALEGGTLSVTDWTRA
jgi:Fur family transcriptional regulator, ferric uptake regulator